MISVISYNILHGLRLRQIMRWVSQEHQMRDIYCFQEYPETQIAYAVQALSGARDLKYIFSHNFTKRGRVYGQLTLYDANKVTLAQVARVPLGSPNIFERVFFHLRGQKHALVSHFESQQGKFALVNTHLTALGTNAKRRSQIDAIMRYLQSDMLLGIPKVLVGDFNYTSLFKQHLLFHFMKKYGLENAYRAYTHKLFFLKQQLDYVFFHNCSISDFRIFNMPFSDHYPLTFSINIPQTRTHDKN